MPILQEVTASLKVINELVFELFEVNTEDLDEVQNSLTSQQYKYYKKMVDIQTKLRKDDEYSLSDKGLIAYRDNSQLLLNGLIGYKEKRIVNYTKSKSASPLFNYNTHLLNINNPVRLMATFFHLLMLVIALILSIGVISISYLVTDNNYLIFFFSIFSLLFLFMYIPSYFDDIEKTKIPKAFKISAFSLFIWGAYYRLIPILGLGMIAIAVKPYWKDDIILILFICFPILILYFHEKTNDWLSAGEKIEKYINSKAENI